MKISYNAPVILSFALICSAIFFIDSFMAGNVMPYFSVGTQFSAHPVVLFSMFSHVIGHASIDHLLGNMTFILLLGPIVEEKYGSGKTLMMIAITAVLTAIINMAFFSTGLLGASGIVFMLILLVSFTNVKDGKIPLTFILVALLFVGKEIVHVFQDDNVSQAAHIIGGICGSIFGFILGRKNS
jgi:membrane associated rhomboid family serine protease